MSKENSLWGAPRIHGELLKLGFEIAESTVSKYMIRHRGAAIADLADIPAQPCRSHRGDRSLRGSNADLRASVCLSGSGPRTATAALVRGDAAPDRRVAGAANLGVVSLGRGAALVVARTLPRIRQ